MGPDLCVLTRHRDGTKVRHVLTRHRYGTRPMGIDQAYMWDQGETCIDQT